jgi:hypothetical protein
MNMRARYLWRDKTYAGRVEGGRSIVIDVYKSEPATRHPRSQVPVLLIYAMLYGDLTL